MSSILGRIPVQIQAGLIAALVSILAVVLGEVFVRQRTRRAAKQSVRNTYQKYADPLALSSVELFWRLREVFNSDGNGFYLKGSTHVTSFENYKVLSTLYRLASLLGWIRALRRELQFLPSTRRRTGKDLELAMSRLGAAFAEGGHVEKRRVESLMPLWGIGRPSIAEGPGRAGISIDYRLKTSLHQARVSTPTDLGDDDKSQLSREIANLLTDAIGHKMLSEEVLAETRSRAMSALAIREAWIYRDWQAAVGDVMLRQASPGPRLFEVIGYRDFELLAKEGADAERMWLRRLYAVIDDLDSLGDKTSDARIEQLYEVHLANAEIVRALHRAGASQSRITTETWKEVDTLLKSSSR